MTQFRTKPLASYALLMLLTISVLPGCNGGKPEPPSDQQPTAELTFQCVRLDSAIIQKWIDGGIMTKDGSDSINFLFLQPHTPAPDNSSNLGLVVYPAKDLMNVNVDGKAVLERVDTCWRKFTGELIIGNNYISFKKLDLIDSATGGLKPFRYLLFRPYKGKGNYLIYKVSKYEAGEPVFRDEFETDPCPPYCNETES